MVAIMKTLRMAQSPSIHPTEEYRRVVTLSMDTLARQLYSQRDDVRLGDVAGGLLLVPGDGAGNPRITPEHQIGIVTSTTVRVGLPAALMNTAAPFLTQDFIEDVVGLGDAFVYAQAPTPWQILGVWTVLGAHGFGVHDSTRPADGGSAMARIAYGNGHHATITWDSLGRVGACVSSVPLAPGRSSGPTLPRDVAPSNVNPTDPRVVQLNHYVQLGVLYRGIDAAVRRL